MHPGDPGLTLTSTGDLGSQKGLGLFSLGHGAARHTAREVVDALEVRQGVGLGALGAQAVGLLGHQAVGAVYRGLVGEGVDRALLTFENASHGSGAPMPAPEESFVYSEKLGFHLSDHYADSVWDGVHFFPGCGKEDKAEYLAAV